MRNWLTRLAGGFVLAAALAEAILHLLPVSTGYELGGVDRAQPILHGASGFAYTYSRDWNFHLENSGVLNNYGFRSSLDYQRDPRALVFVGNSFIQADAIVPRENVTERLGSLLGRPAYAVGVDGFSLADYLAAARWSSETFRASTVLILLTTGDLRHTCLQSTGMHYLRSADGEWTLALVNRPSPSMMKRLINRSRLFRYVYDNLRVTPNWSRGWRRDQADATPVATPPASRGAPSPSLGCAGEVYEDAATHFLLESFRELEQSHNVRVVFVLAPGYRREQTFEAGQVRDVDRFAGRAEQSGFAVVPLERAFAAALQSGRRLDFLPIDGHWNQFAHELAARVIAAELRRRAGAGSVATASRREATSGRTADRSVSALTRVSESTQRADQSVGQR